MKATMLLAILALCLFLVRSSYADVALGPNPIIAGFSVSCYGANTIVVDGLNDVAESAPGAILLNSILLESFPPVVQLFVYAHECGHQVVGLNEFAADCWAVKVGRNQGWLTMDGISTVEAGLANSPGDWTHMPGPERIQAMTKCYTTP